MTVFDRLLRYAKLKPSEEKNFRLLFVQAMLSGFATSIFFVVVSSYFIGQKNSIANLPYAYIISGVFGYLLTALYKRQLRRSGVVAGYSTVLLSFGLWSVALLICRLLIPDKSPYAIYVAYAGFVVVLPFLTSLALGFSSITVRVFNIAQSKRLLALIGSGEVIASIIAYLSVPVLTRLVGGHTPALLIFAATANFLAVFALRNVYKHNKEKLDATKVANLVKTVPLSFFTKNKFYSLIAIVTIFSVLAVYLTDYSYLIAVRYINLETENTISIATLVAIIFSIIKSGELIFSLLSGTIISSRGMKFAMIMQPLVLLAFAVLAAVLGFLFPSITFFVIAFLLFNKWAVRVVSRSLTAPAMKVMYQVTDHKDRAQLQTSIDGTLNQYSTIVSGVLLLVIFLLFGVQDINKYQGNTRQYLADVLFYLEIIAVVCIPIFAIWLWISLKLFGNYKIKIKEYLYQLIKNEKHSIIADDEITLADAPIILEHHPLVAKARKDSSPLTLKELDEYITYYNPTIKTSVGENALYLSLLRRAYYNNENFFSRLLIVWHTEVQPMHARVNFVKEYYNISELHLKLQMIIMLTAHGFHPDPEDRFFFTGLCEQCAEEIIWTEASIYDLTDKVDQLLIDALTEQLKTLRNLLFELLKILYEKESIKAVQDIVNSKDQSVDNQLFAIELMDNLLHDEMKRIVIPLFEDISFNAKMARLQKHFLIYHSAPAARLKEILMANFMTVGPNIKQLAIEEYYKLTSDRNILSAFSSSFVENLNATANVLLNPADEQIYHDKLVAIEHLKLHHTLTPAMLTYFVKWGLFSVDKKAKLNLHKNIARQTYQFNTDFVEVINSDKNKFSLDLLGLSLLYRLNK